MTARIILEFEEIPAAKDLAELVSLAEKIHARVVEMPGTSTQKSTLDSKNGTPIHLGFEKFPTELGAFAVAPEQMVALSEVFDDEPSAEELCAMLAP